MKNLITKANAARTGRRQGKQRWATVEFSQPMTLLLIAEQARPDWFTEWGLPVREVCRGLWVHEDDLLSTVIVRPFWLGQHPGAHLWGTAGHSDRGVHGPQTFQALARRHIDRYHLQVPRG